MHRTLLQTPQRCGFKAFAVRVGTTFALGRKPQVVFGSPAVQESYRGPETGDTDSVKFRISFGT